MQTSWHGFTRVLDFAKATLSLGLVIGTMVWGVLAFALDGKYASKIIESAVESNTILLEDVQTQVTQVRGSLMQRDLVDIKARSCAATSSEAKQYFAAQLQELVTTIERLEGIQPFVPSCEDLQ